MFSSAPLLIFLSVMLLHFRLFHLVALCVDDSLPVTAVAGALLICASAFAMYLVSSLLQNRTRINESGVQGLLEL